MTDVVGGPQDLPARLDPDEIVRLTPLPEHTPLLAQEPQVTVPRTLRLPIGTTSRSLNRMPRHPSRW
jgi:hypothetical protein